MTLPAPYWQSACGRYTIYQGDFIDIFPYLVRANWIITDPPYGRNNANRWFGNWRTSNMPSSDWDMAPADLGSLLASGIPMVVWGGNYFALPPSRRWFVWDKGAGFRGRGFAECELAWCSVDGNARVLCRDPLASGDYADKQHPTQKPVPVMTWCMEQAGVPDDALVCDPFAGSGSTGVACVKTNRRFVGIEISADYCAIARRRIEAEANHLFAEVKP